MADDEDSDAYKSFSSGNSAVEDFNDGNDDVEHTAAAEDDVDWVSDNDAVEMDEAFVISLQVVAKTLSKSAMQQRAVFLCGPEQCSVRAVNRIALRSYSTMEYTFGLMIVWVMRKAMTSC